MLTAESKATSIHSGVFSNNRNVIEDVTYSSAPLGYCETHTFTHTRSAPLKFFFMSCVCQRGRWQRAVRNQQRGPNHCPSCARWRKNTQQPWRNYSLVSVALHYTSYYQYQEGVYDTWIQCHLNYLNLCIWQRFYFYLFLSDLQCILGIHLKQNVQSFIPNTSSWSVLPSASHFATRYHNMQLWEICCLCFVTFKHTKYWRSMKEIESKRMDFVISVLVQYLFFVSFFVSLCSDWWQEVCSVKTDLVRPQTSEVISLDVTVSRFTVLHKRHPLLDVVFLESPFVFLDDHC